MTAHRPRLSVPEAAPEAYRAMLALDRCLQDGPLPAELRELVGLRASRLNGCSFCTDLHSRAARGLGVRDEKLLAVAAWRAAPFFAPAERAALALTDAATRLGEDGVPEDVWRQAAAHFEGPAMAALVLTIAAVNAWNRVAVATGLTAEPPGSEPGRAGPAADG